MTDDTKIAVQPFTVDPGWYRAYWFAEGKSASPPHDLEEARHRPSRWAWVFSVVGPALAAVLGFRPSREAVGRS